MADYYNPTVIVPPIPLKDISLFELFIMKNFFEFDELGDTIYFYSSEGCYYEKDLKIGHIRENLDPLQLEQVDRKYLSNDLREWIDHNKPDEEFPFTVAFDEDVLVEFLQNIIDRSDSVKRIDVISSYTCSKMTMDGFGGRRVSVTKDFIDEIDTNNLENDIIETVEETKPANELTSAIEALVQLALDTQACMNGFAEMVRNVTGTPYPWPEMDIINDRFVKAGLDKLINENKRDLSEEVTNPVSVRIRNKN